MTRQDPHGVGQSPRVLVTSSFFFFFFFDFADCTQLSASADLEYCLFERMTRLALNFAHPERDHLAIRTPPRCLYCSSRTILSYCLPWNENGNGYRPYYHCSYCPRFSCFGDMRGVLAENPTCFCDHGMQFSRRTVSGVDAEIPRSIIYQCATGGCFFFERMMNDEGSLLIYPGPVTRHDLIFEGF